MAGTGAVLSTLRTGETIEERKRSMSNDATATEPASAATGPGSEDDRAHSHRVAKAARRGRSRRRMRARLLQAGVLVGVIALWWLITAIKLVDPLYLPSPQAVLGAFVDANRCQVIDESTGRTVCGVQNYYLWEHLVASLQRIGVGVALGAVCGILLGFLMSMWEPANTALAPYLNFLRALPPLGYIGLIIVWVGIGDTSKYLLLFLAAFPPIVIATIDGVRGVREDYVLAARSMGAGPTGIGRFVVLPAATASILSGVRLAIGFAWTTVVAAELNNGIPGIGGLAYISGTRLNTDLTIACIIVIGLVAVALDGCIRLVGNRLTPWYGKA
ncbi:taurine ABC transporter permease TauC [Brachybacterium fresconis]